VSASPWCRSMQNSGKKTYEVDLEDLEAGAMVKVSVNPDGPTDTAERLYAKVSKATKARKKLKPMLDMAIEEEKDVSDAVDLLRVLSCATPNGEAAEFCAELAMDIDRIERRLKVWGVKVRSSPQKKKVQTEKQRSSRDKVGSSKSGMRKFITPIGGNIVIAGRHSEANEKISLKMAQKDDLWFHAAQGVAGSHVLLRRSENGMHLTTKERRKGSLAGFIEEDVQFAAQVASKYSKGGDNAKVPILCVQNPHRAIRKPPGSSNVGTVFVIPGSTQKTIIAR